MLAPPLAPPFLVSSLGDAAEKPHLQGRVYLAGQGIETPPQETRAAAHPTAIRTNPPPMEWPAWRPTRSARRGFPPFSAVDREVPFLGSPPATFDTILGTAGRPLPGASGHPHRRTPAAIAPRYAGSCPGRRNTQPVGAATVTWRIPAASVGRRAGLLKGKALT